MHLNFIAFHIYRQSRNRKSQKKYLLKKQIEQCRNDRNVTLILMSVYVCMIFVGICMSLLRYHLHDKKIA